MLYREIGAIVKKGIFKIKVEKTKNLTLSIQELFFSYQYQ